MGYRKVVVVGLDGLDPGLVESMMAAGELPTLAGLRRRGGYARVATTLPAQTPVAWSTFAVGANPGAHGIYDFLRRDPATYLPDIGLYRHEQRNRFLPPRAVNLRGGTPVWERLTRAGIPSVILRHPCTYPPEPLLGRMLAGIGVPDMRGGFGSSTFYTTDGNAAVGESEHLFRVEVDAEGRGSASLLGPRISADKEMRISVDLAVDPGAGRVTVTCEGSAPVQVALREWSGWVPVRFRLGLLQAARGLVRFFLSDLEPLRLFATPVHFDPEVPLFPISHPWDYAASLRRVMGPYATLGLAEEHNGLTNGRLDESAFLAQCLDVLRERRAMMHHELARLDQGLFYCLFATPDRIQHMFWRFREPEHPANHGQAPPPEMVRVIEDYYRLADEVVGEALAYADDHTLVLVASDHGFTSFQREVHLNGWLLRNGYLALKPGVEAGAGAGDLLKQVDWGRTRAYALGLAGLYLNLRGREGGGVVEPEAAPALGEEISARLRGLEDPARGTVAIRDAMPREAVYSGPFLDQAPDVLVAFTPGYRAASADSMGAVGAEDFTDNTRPWSGDHTVDPVAVPGVLFMSAPFRGEGARLVDLAPTILDALQVTGEEGLEGASLLS